jgi:hypothetical protein
MPQLALVMEPPQQVFFLKAEAFLRFGLFQVIQALLSILLLCQQM